MTDEQRKKILDKTDHTYEQIIAMNKMDFFSKITKCFLSNRLRRSEHNWLQVMRQKHHLSPQEQGVLEVFDKAEFV